MAYVIGAVLGDGCVKLDRYRKERRCRYMILLKVKDYDFAIEFGRWIAIVVGRDKPYRPRWDGHKERRRIKDILT